MRPPAMWPGVTALWLTLGKCFLSLLATGYAYIRMDYHGLVPVPSFLAGGRLLPKLGQRNLLCMLT